MDGDFSLWNHILSAFKKYLQNTELSIGYLLDSEYNLRSSSWSTKHLMAWLHLSDMLSYSQQQTLKISQVIRCQSSPSVQRREQIYC